MKLIVRKNSYFLVPYFLFLILGVILIMLNSKPELHLFFNQFHNRFSDLFFSNLTYLGDGLFFISIVVVFLFIKFKSALVLGFSYALSSIMAQLLKNTLFSGVLRPKKFFEGVHNLYFVPGIENHSFNSFPSGHATSAFALFFCLSLMTESNVMKFLFFVLALLIAYSRVYLSQHFFGDIYAGSLLGMFTSLIVYYRLDSSTKWNNKSWMEKSLGRN